MTMNRLANELLDLEKQFWEAMKERDVDTAMQLTADECILTGAQGVSNIKKQALGDMLQNAPYELHAYELKDPVVREIQDDVAILAYNVHEELTVDGKPVKLDAADSSTWIKRDGQWRCVLHTEAISGDPFGRDRRA